MGRTRRVGRGGGGASVSLAAADTSWYNHWVSFSGVPVASVGATEIREELFEKGAIPDQVIATGTEAAMQTALEAFDDTARPDVPVCFRIEANTGDTDFTLTATDITFHERASVYVQYMGSATLTWRNDGSTAQIGSTPGGTVGGGGTIVFADVVTATVTVLDAGDGTAVQGARVWLTTDGGTTVPLNSITNASGIASARYDYTTDTAVTGRVRKGTTSPLYKSTTVTGTIVAIGLDITVFVVRDD